MTAFFIQLRMSIDLDTICLNTRNCKTKITMCYWNHISKRRSCKIYGIYSFGKDNIFTRYALEYITLHRNEIPLLNFIKNWFNIQNFSLPVPLSLDNNIKYCASITCYKNIYASIISFLFIIFNLFRSKISIKYS